MPCHLCGRSQTDPKRGDDPWAVGVIGTEQVLICPVCQSTIADWRAGFEVCPRCGSTRLSRTLGENRCRECGDTFGGNADDAWIEN